MGLDHGIKLNPELTRLHFNRRELALRAKSFLQRRQIARGHLASAAWQEIDQRRID